jgi:hypothetical protein
MTEKPAGAVAENQHDDGDDEDRRDLGRSRERDPFAAAFKKAEKQLSGPEKAPKSKPKAKAAVADDDDDDDDDQGDRHVPAKKKPQVKAPAKKPVRDEAEDEDDDLDDDDEGDDEPKSRRNGEAARSGEKRGGADKGKEDGDKPESKAKEPLKPKDWWSQDRRRSFPYQQREVQETWLAEAPAAPEHWPEESKALFAKQPREAQEVMMTIHQSMARGYDEKFTALATERKLAEAVKQVPNETQRAFMQKRGLNEAQVFSALMRLQDQSQRDPVGYIRDFIMRNKLDPRSVLGKSDGAGGEGGDGEQPRQADVESHPAYRTLKQEVEAMKAAQMEDARRRDEEADRRISSEMSAVLAETDEGGNPAYPYARLLQAEMARILTADPERFDALSTRDRFVTAYQLALEGFPEIPAPQKAAKRKQADEPDEADTVDPDEDEEEERLSRARTKKSKRPAAASRDRGDPFDRAFRKAEKQTGQR